MKVVQVVTGITQESSGPSHALIGLCFSLKTNGVDVELHVIKSARCNELIFPTYGYPARRWPIRTIWRSPEMAYGVEDACGKADVIHNNGLWTMPNIYPYWAAKRHAVKVVTSPHGTFSPWAIKKSRLKKILFGMLLQYSALKRTDMFHATCEKEYKEIRAQGYKQPVAIIPIGLDVPTLATCHLPLATEHNRLRRIVFFGRVHKVKAVDHLVKAWGQLQETLPDWELVIAGPDCGAQGELEAIIAERKIPRVRFVGEINGSAKYDFLTEADIYVLPSHTENFGVTVAEALACGTPTIASQGTPWEGLETERCGKWVPIGVEPLAEALRELTSLTDEERTEMGKRGRAWIQRDFSWDGVGAKMKAAYEWLLGKGEKPDFVRVD